MGDFRDRRVIALLRSELERAPVVILGGIRGGGKTAVLQHGFEGARRYLSLGRLRLRMQARQRPREFLLGLTGPTTLDQVDMAPELLAALLEWCAAARGPARPPQADASRRCLAEPPVAGSLLLGVTPSGLLDSDTLRAGITKPAAPPAAPRAAAEDRPDRPDRPDGSPNARSSSSARGHALRLGWDVAGCPKIDCPMVSYVTQWSLSSSEIQPRGPDDSLARFAQGLIRGGMPGPGWHPVVRARTESGDPNAWLGPEVESWKQRYWNGLLSQDFTRLLRRTSRGAFERFLLQVAQDCGRPVNYTRWAQAAGVTTNTVRVWWRMLMLSGLSYITPSISARSGLGRPGVRSAMAPRGYLSDTGLLAGLLGVGDPEDALTGRYADRLLLTYVGGELMRLASDAGEADSGDGAVLYHWRPAQRTGIDFIFESEGRVYSVICTTASTPSRAQIKAVEQFALGVPPTFRGPALAICYRERAERLGGMQLLPAPRLRLIAE